MAEEGEGSSLVKGLILDYLTVLDASVLRKSEKWVTAVVGMESQHGEKSLHLFTVGRTGTRIGRSSLLSTLTARGTGKR